VYNETNIAAAADSLNIAVKNNMYWVIPNDYMRESELPLDFPAS
jgi:hypothetical protein